MGATPHFKAYGLWLTILASIVEPAVIVIVACLPTLRPLYMLCIK